MHGAKLIKTFLNRIKDFCAAYRSVLDFFFRALGSLHDNPQGINFFQPQLLLFWCRWWLAMGMDVWPMSEWANIVVICSRQSDQFTHSRFNFSSRLNVGGWVDKWIKRMGSWKDPICFKIGDVMRIFWLWS